MAKVLPLFSTDVKETEEEEEFLFVQYMKCSAACENVDKTLDVLSLSSSTDEDRDHTLLQRPCFSREDSLRAGEWFRFNPLCPKKGRLHVMGEKFCYLTVQRGYRLANQTI